MIHKYEEVCIPFLCKPYCFKLLLIWKLSKLSILAYEYVAFTTIVGAFIEAF